MSYETVHHAIEDIILTSYESMYRLAYTYVKNEQDALDIVQESIYKAIKNSDQIDNVEVAKSWIWRILVNTAIDYVRKNKREVIVSDISDNEKIIGDKPFIDIYEDIDMLDALDILSDREKAVVILRYFEDMKISEVAQCLGENINTVKSVLYRSLKKLKTEITGGGS